MNSTNSNLSQRFLKCDGNVCINKSKFNEFIIFEKVLYIKLCGDCYRLACLGQQIRMLTDTTELEHFSNPFAKWEDLTQLKVNHVFILGLLKSILKRVNEFYDLISSTWYGLDALEKSIENVISNINLVQNLINSSSINT